MFTVVWNLLQVLDEIGIDITSQLAAAPRQKVAQRQAASSSAAVEDDELTARLAALK